MKQKLKSFLGKALYKTGILSGVRKIFANKDVTVLMYHHVDPKTFEDQVIYIKEKYNPITEKDLIDYYNKKKDLPKNSVLLTFDDGYYNNYKYAYPILKKHKVPAVIFLVSGLIGKQIMPWYDRVDYLITHTKASEISLLSKTHRMNASGKKKLKKECYYYMINVTTEERNALIRELEKKTKTKIPTSLPEQYRFMNWKQVKEIQDVFAIGSHTYNHPILPNETAKEQEFQIKKSYDDLKKQGITPASFCYPNGDYSHITVDIVKKYFKIGYSANFGRTNRKINKYLVQRVGANIQDNKYILAVKLSVLRKLFNRNKKSTSFKVIHLTNYYFPQTGGITTAVHTIKSHLEKYTIPNSVVAYPYFFRKIENSTSRSYIFHKALVVLYALGVFLYVLLNKIKYRKIVLHSHSANFCAQISQMVSILGVKTIHTFHTDPRMNNVKGHPQPRPFLNKIDKLTAVSKNLGKESAKIFGVSKDIEIIYNSIKLDIDITPAKKKASESLKVTMVGHLLPIKDPLLFVKTIQELQKNHKVKAQMIGDGPLRKTVEDYVQQHKIPIAIRGSLSHKEALQAMADADVFVLPSKGEGLAIVLLEAISLKTPIVAAKVGGIPEIIIPGKTGILVSSRDPKDFAKAVIEANKKRSTLIKGSQLLMEETFDNFKNMNRYVNKYCYLVQEKVAKSSENGN